VELPDSCLGILDKASSSAPFLSLKMRVWSPAFLQIVSLSYAAVGNAIFADEAYQTDYHHALLGFPQAHTTFFHRPSAASKASLLYTLSERFVLGAVNPKDGAVIWRQRLTDRAQNETGPGLLKGEEGGDTLVSAVYGKVQTWDATDGRLVWEWVGDERIQGLEIVEGERDVIAFSGGHGTTATVRRLVADTGETRWKHTDARFAVCH
jgi:outer membrane protein assembly factor BamB